MKNFEKCDKKSNHTEIEAQKKKSKKYILIVFLSMLAFILVYYASIHIYNLINASQSNNNDFDFYMPDFEENIFEDTQYIDLFTSYGGITYIDNSTRISTTINDEEYELFSEDLKLLYRYISFAIQGDIDGYNGCFSDEYFENHEKQTPFTMQKIYNIQLTKMAEYTATDDNGFEYRKYEYSVEYMIRHNNGTLRNDMGSDCIRLQYFVISDLSGNALIDNVLTINY